jgi:pantoate kinase
MVQVTLEDDLELRGIDEELGPAGTLADDELRGAARVRAVREAFAETGIGKVVSVERDANGGIEVRVRTGSGRQKEVELDRNFRVVEIDDESLGDE